MITTDFGDLISARIRAEHESLAARWFERLADVLPVGAQQIFPSQSLLDHIPALILEISTYLRSDQDAALAADSVILDKARELGALRHEQRASLHQVLREYQILGGILVQFVVDEIDRLGSPPTTGCVQVVSRIHQAVDVLSQTTVEAFVALYTRTIADQTERLDQFTRMATHEWRQPVNTLQFAIGVLRRRQANGEPLDDTLDVMQRNVSHLVDLTHKLEAMARLRVTGDTMVTQHVSLHTVVREAARQLRDMAASRRVDVRIAKPMPELTVDVGRLELTLVNLLSNAIKYADLAKDDRYVEIQAAGEAAWCRLIVRDNGVGIPSEALDVIFQRFTRVHQDAVPSADGVGLGLSIVDDCVRAMGGMIEVASEEGVGSTFTLSIPTDPPTK